MKATATFPPARYLWDEAQAAALAGDEVALFVYRSSLRGAAPRLTNYAGGNTSRKIGETDPLAGQPTQVMWVEGSGRAKAYGISVEELPAHYARRTLLAEEVLAENIAQAVRVFVGGSLAKRTGNVLGVDGGAAMALVR